MGEQLPFAGTLALVLAGGAVVVALNLLGRRIGVPASVLLVLAGLAYGWLPGPNIDLSPSFVLGVLIPPLLYAAALKSSAVALRANLRTIVSLSVGLVVATSLAVGAALSAVVPAVSLAAAIALGAAVSPPDPVASLSIGRRAGLPRRLVTIIEGEGLLNDATALTLLQVAVAATLGRELSVLHAAADFGRAAAGGAAAGLLVAVAVAALQRRIDEPLATNAMSLGTPFVAYLLAGAVGGSGVLAVVVAGLWFAHRGPTVQSGSSRLQAHAVWNLVEFLLEGFVFLLIGQQLPQIVRGLQQYPASTVLAATVATLGAVLLVRPVWLTVSELLPARLHTRLAGDGAPGRHAHLSAPAVLALSWAGTRGVITLAAAFSLPLTLANGEPLPGRDLLLFCAYLVVLVTLVGQGLTFAPLLRRLGLAGSDGGDALLRNEARAAAVRAALDRLDELEELEDLPPEVVGPLRQAAQSRLSRYRGRIDRLSRSASGHLPPEDPYFTAVRLRRELIEVERDALLQWRDSGRLPDETLRVLQRELDHEEGLLPLLPGARRA